MFLSPVKLYYLFDVAASAEFEEILFLSDRGKKNISER
jgi:hypothetical protein